MNTQQFTELRKKSGTPQKKVAISLGISSRTVATWESSTPPKDISFATSQALSELFCPQIIEPQLIEMCDQAFEVIKSELVAIWIVREKECFLLPQASRYHDFNSDEFLRIEKPTAKCVASLVDESLTTYPLRSGESINLAGDAILHHKAKKYKATRAAHFFKDGFCESLLHVPGFLQSAMGPRPILLLSFENKLKDGKVIVPGEGKTVVYTKEDEGIAKNLVEEFRERLLPDLKLLDII